MEILDIVLSFIALVCLEVILGFDNLIYLVMLTNKLGTHQRRLARRLGLAFATITRLILLACAVYLVKLTTPWISYGQVTFSGRDLFLLIGGGFLIAKATQEIHREVDEAHESSHSSTAELKSTASMGAVILQVAVMDIIFSLDSVLTAIGLTMNYAVMTSAILLSLVVMLMASDVVAMILERNPTLKMLALSFLILIGMALVADGLSFHIPRGYVYCAMGFSLSVEGLNCLKRARDSRKRG